MTCDPFPRARHLRAVSLMALVGIIAACETGVSVSRAEPEPLRSRAEGPPDARPGSCWGRDTTPAVVETVTNQILIQPAEIGTDGAIRSPAVYKTETRQQIVVPRRDIWFETLCEQDLTIAFISSLQRALAARGHYSGAISGEMDSKTRRAIRAFQSAQGLNSAILSLAASRQLGLTPYDRTGRSET